MAGPWGTAATKIYVDRMKPAHRKRVADILKLCAIHLEAPPPPVAKKRR